jgi:hypothetical protein
MRNDCETRTRHTVVLSLWIVTMMLAIPRPAAAVPAFARKYGVRCTVCHEAWPVLNDFGRAFRDNGYRMNLGKDEPTAVDPAYWPIYAEAQPHYGFDLVKSHGAAGDTTLEKNGLFQTGLAVLGAIGTLGEHASYLVIPVASVNGVTLGFPTAEFRLNDLFDSSWLNVRLGNSEPDLPVSRVRDLDLTGVGMAAYAYHTPGSLSTYDTGGNQLGVEFMGHNRGSLTRYSVSVFNVTGSPEKDHAFNTPGVSGHVTHEFSLDQGPLSAVEVGGFASYATWPIGVPGGNATPTERKAATKYGGEVHAWFGPQALPVHAIAMLLQGRDDRALVPGGVRDGVFNGGFVEVIANPKLPVVVFGRFDFVRNQDQALATQARDFNDQTAYSLGVKHTFEYTTRVFPKAEPVFHVKCDVHPWMSAYLATFTHPFFGVSNSLGTVELGNLPAGTFQIQAWHEKYGVQTQAVSVSAGETKQLTFAYKGGA